MRNQIKSFTRWSTHWLTAYFIRPIGCQILIECQCYSRIAMCQQFNSMESFLQAIFPMTISGKTENQFTIQLNCLEFNLIPNVWWTSHNIKSLRSQNLFDCQYTGFIYWFVVVVVILFFFWFTLSLNKSNG